MGAVCNNYGTFVDVEGSREEGDAAAGPAPALDQGQEVSAIEHRLLRDWEGRFGLRLRKDGVDIIVSEVDDDVARARGLCEGDVVTHLDGKPLLGSLQNTAECIEQAGNSLVLRVQLTDDNRSRRDNIHVKAKDDVVHHTLRQSDTIEALAELYGTTPEQIRAWNRKHFPVGEPGALVPGQVVTLRTSTVGHTRGAKKTILQRTTEEPNKPAARRRKSERGDRRKRMLYEVREGDTLKAISARLNVKEEEVRLLNRSVFPVGEAGALVPGQTLRIFAAEGEGLSEDGTGWSAVEEDCERELLRGFVSRKGGMWIRPTAVMGY